MDPASQSAAERLINADPMMRVLHERHPDVNIVLLPPVPPVVDLPVATWAQCRGLQDHAERVLDTLTSRLAREPVARTDYWWGQAHPEVRRWVLAVTFGDFDEHGDIEFLRALGNLLIELRWDPRPAADGSPQLRGVAGPYELVAGAGDGLVSVQLVSEPLHVPEALHDELVTGS